MLIGYARVSTDDQHLDNQRIALRAAGCQRIYEEKISGAKRERPEHTRVLDHLREGDVLVATRLDRLARATRDLLELAEILNRAGVGLRSLGEPWANTTSPSGKMVFTVFAGIAEFERSLIAERTSAGRLAAQGKGVRFGRPPKLRRCNKIKLSFSERFDKLSAWTMPRSKNVLKNSIRISTNGYVA